MYNITYSNGVTQKKRLIPQSDYNNIIRPKLIEAEKFFAKNDKAKGNALKAEIKAQFGDNYFTDESPLYEAIESGILSLPKIQGGNTACTIKFRKAINKK